MLKILAEVLSKEQCLQICKRFLSVNKTLRYDDFQLMEEFERLFSVELMELIRKAEFYVQINPVVSVDSLRKESEFAQDAPSAKTSRSSHVDAVVGSRVAQPLADESAQAAPSAKTSRLSHADAVSYVRGLITQWSREQN